MEKSHPGDAWSSTKSASASAPTSQLCTLSVTLTPDQQLSESGQSWDPDTQSTATSAPKMATGEPDKRSSTPRRKRTKNPNSTPAQTGHENQNCHQSLVDSSTAANVADGGGDKNSTTARGKRSKKPNDIPSQSAQQNQIPNLELANLIHLISSATAGNVSGGGGKSSTTARGKKKDKKSKELPTPAGQPDQELAEAIPIAASATAAAHTFLKNNDLLLHPAQALTLESQLSSAYLSLSKLVSTLSISPSAASSSTTTTSSSPPPSCWFHRFLSDASDDYDTRWKDFFGMSKPSFVLLLRILSPSLSSLAPLPPNYALAATLFRLAHGAPYKAVGRRFDLDSPTTCRAFYIVCKAINEKLGHLFEFQSDINRIVVGFGWMSLPNCCGVLGLGKFELEIDEVGDKESVMVQVLVDSEGRFLDVSAGWPNTMKPQAILRQTKLFCGVVETKEYLNGPPFELSDGGSIPQYILGDSCFPLLPWLITPYAKSNDADEFSSLESAFNSVHSRGMELVGMAFGRVRARWQLVSKPWSKRCMDTFPHVIVACCLLHNFLIKCSEVMSDENVVCSRDQTFLAFGGQPDATGRSIRDALALHLSRVHHTRGDGSRSDDFEDNQL